jgi:serine/threonine protein kinase
MHPSEVDLAAFALGRLGELRAAIVEHHVNECDRCASLVAQVPGDEFIERLHEAERSNLGAERTPLWRASETDRDESIGETDLEHIPSELRQHHRYEVIRLLADGGMGSVYLARHRIIGNMVALKTIKPELMTDRDTVDRFLREARIAGRLDHKNIARVLDAEHLGDGLFIAMEYVPGKTLAQLVAASGPFYFSDACDCICQAALGIEHATSQGVVHRDIKPQNLMLISSTSTVRILDFGLGRMVDERRSRAGLTKEGDMLGTPHYMAPEQARDPRSADVRSDIYSLGCTFYFLLAGRPPFEGQSVLELLNKHEFDSPPPITSLRGDIPRDVGELLSRMLAKHPNDRPQSPKEVLAALLPQGRSHAAADTVELICPQQPVSESALTRGKFALLRALLSPAVLLPVLTALLCLIFLLMA